MNIKKIISKHNDIHGRVQCFILFPQDIKNMNLKKVNDYEFKYIVFQYNKTPKYFIDLYLPYIRMLKPVKEIENIVNEFSSKFDENTIGIHVRQGDFKLNSSRYIPIEKYYVKIDDFLKINPKHNFFICSDENVIEDEFKKNMVI